MRQIDARLPDGSNALAEFQGASPAGGFVTSQPAKRDSLAPGDVVDCSGPWTVVATVTHNGILGISTVVVITAAGDVIRETLMQTDVRQRRTDMRINADTLHKLLPPGGAPNLRAPRESLALEFAAMVARLQMDGEPGDDGSPWQMPPGDAHDTLTALIGRARDLMRAPGEKGAGN